MSEFSGVVSKVSDFPYKDKKLWSFSLNNHPRTFFRTGETKPRCESGDYVTFKGEEGKNGAITVDPKSIESRPSGNDTSSTGVSSSFKKVSGSKDDYWVQREQRDILVQKRIERQSCRNSALEFIKILLDKGEFKLPVKNKVEALEEMLAHYQIKFIEDNSGEAKSSSRDVAEENTSEGTYS